MTSLFLREEARRPLNPAAERPGVSETAPGPSEPPPRL
jgi:hypothetical protein